MDGSSVLITGANGQLGLALKQKYPIAHFSDIAELDITNLESVINFDWDGISTIINAAGYTNVDGAETKEGRIIAWQVNTLAVANLVKAAQKHHLKLVHISTDYVFDGSKKNHTESEDLSPLGVYASSKAAGDITVGLLPYHYLIRTSWVIGVGKNFVRTMLELGQKGVAPTVVDDQVGRLTFTSELVRAIDYLLSKDLPFGTYNVSNEGAISSWADITEAIFREAGFNLKVGRTSTAKYYAAKEGIAPRPLNSSLDLSKLHSTGFESHRWEDDLKDYVRKERNL